MEVCSYNGWENKFTWLVHLHLSNEECLMNEIVELVAQEPNDGMRSVATAFFWLFCFLRR
jgi:hypothetical protein